jgi:hypothetical protein
VPTTYSIDSYQGTLQLGWRELTLAGQAGATEVDELTRQEVSYWGVSASWIPIRAVTLRAGHHLNTSRLENAPDYDTDRTEVGATVFLGAFEISADAFRINSERPGTPLTTNDGVYLSISRRFGGWLPWVTGPQRRGWVR